MAVRRFDNVQQQLAGDTPMHLQGAWTPVKDEITADNLKAIVGTIPLDLDGQFVRLGANPHHHYKGQPYHFFDGDGHLHATEFKAGRVTYRNRWVKSYRHLATKLVGHDHADFGELSSGNFQPGERVYDETGERMGRANTAMVYHAGRALALEEADKPYRIHLPELETMGRLDFGGKLKHPMTAHPKVDPITGYMYFFGYSLMQAPFLSFSVVDPKGDLIRTFDIDLECATMMHDMAMTDKHCIILDHPLHFRPERLAIPPPPGQSPNPWVMDDVPSRFGIMTKEATSQDHIRWFLGETCMTFHVANAWEEGDRIIMWGTPSKKSVIAATGPGADADPAYNQHWHQWVFNLKTGQTEVDATYHLDTWVEFPQVDRYRFGHKTRYLYGTRMIYVGVEITRIPSLVKLDVDTKEQTEHLFPEYMWGGEFVFAPKVGRKADEEDAGYLVGYVTHDTTLESDIYIVDAKTMKCACRVRAPRLIPHGLHAYWFEREEIMKQRMAL